MKISSAVPLRRQGPIFKPSCIEQPALENDSIGDGPLPSQGHGSFGRGRA